jgi:hypothetical protein
MGRKKESESPTDYLKYCVIVFRDNGNVELHVPDSLDLTEPPEHVAYAKEVMRWIALDASVNEESTH